ETVLNDDDEDRPGEPARRGRAGEGIVEDEAERRGNVAGIDREYEQRGEDVEHDHHGHERRGDLPDRFDPTDEDDERADGEDDPGEPDRYAEAVLDVRGDRVRLGH